MNGYRARFNAAHFQHIIDQGEQMLRGLGDFGQIVLHRLLILDMLSSQISEAHNRIHRRSDIMRHVVQKDCLGAVRLLCQHQRLAKLRLMLLLQPQLAISSSLLRAEQPDDEGQHDQQQYAADYTKDSDQLIRLLVKNSLRRYGNEVPVGNIHITENNDAVVVLLHRRSEALRALRQLRLDFLYRAIVRKASALDIVKEVFSRHKVMRAINIHDIIAVGIYYIAYALALIALDRKILFNITHANQGCKVGVGGALHGERLELYAYQQIFLIKLHIVWRYIIVSFDNALFLIAKLLRNLRIVLITDQARAAVHRSLVVHQHQHFGVDKMSALTQLCQHLFGSGEAFMAQVITQGLQQAPSFVDDAFYSHTVMQGDLVHGSNVGVDDIFRYLLV